MKADNQVKITNQTILGETLSEVCNHLRNMSIREFKIAQKRFASANVMPLSKNQFIEKLYAEYQGSNNNDVESLAKELANKIKTTSVIGDYGRMASLITSVELIPFKDIVIYYPIDKKPGNLPAKKYIHSKTKKENPLVTAMGGGQEEWQQYLNDENLSEEANNFYNNNKKLLDDITDQFKFLARFDTFYSPNRMAEINLSLADDKNEKLCVFDSNASQMKDGQWLFAAPSGLPEQGFVENVLKEKPLIARLLDHKRETGKYPGFFQSNITNTSKQLIDNSKNPASLIQASAEMPVKNTPAIAFETSRERSKSNPQKPSDLFTLQSIDAKEIIKNIPVDESAQFVMHERADIVFALSHSLSNEFVLFQNSPDTASVPMHYHCYAIKKDKLLEQSGHSYPIPLLNTSAAETIFDKNIEDVPVKFEKMDWAAACYRLTIPINAHINETIEKFLTDLQDDTLKSCPDCSFTYIASKKDNQLEFYIGFRKQITVNPMPNLTAKENGLQPPFNGCLEFAGVHTMKDKTEFDKYNNLYKQNPDQAKQIFTAIQNESLSKLKPDQNQILIFEKNANHLLSKHAHNRNYHT